MDIDALLGTHERQHPELRSVIGRIRSMRDQIAGVEGQEYQPGKASTLVADIRQATATAIAAELRSLLEQAANDAEAAMDERDADERDRLANANGAHIDPMRFTRATTPAEISVLLNDAAATDADSARKAWAYGQPRLREMAARELREHRQPGATSAFNALVTWQSRMADVTRRAPDRTTMMATSTRRQRELRERVLAVARLVALDGAVSKQLVEADVAERTPNDGGEPAKGTLVVGKWFDRFTTKQ